MVPAGSRRVRGYYTRSFCLAEDTIRSGYRYAADVLYRIYTYVSGPYYEFWIRPTNCKQPNLPPRDNLTVHQLLINPNGASDSRITQARSTHFGWRVPN